MTGFLNGDGVMAPRGKVSNANISVGAPYGIYKCNDGYLAIAMTPIAKLAELIDCKDLEPFTDPDDAFRLRDDIKAILRDHLVTQSVRYWLDRLEPADIWCAEVLDWPALLETEGFAALDMLQDIVTPGGTRAATTRCPIRIDGAVFKSTRGGPALGADTDEFLG